MSILKEISKVFEILEIQSRNDKKVMELLKLHTESIRKLAELYQRLDARIGQTTRSEK